MSAVIWWFEHSLVLPFLGIGMRIDLFQTCGHCWVLQISWHIEYNTLIASFFRVLNSSAGIPLHPLALLTAVLLKAHLTSHSRMFGSEWETTAWWLSGWLISFLYGSSVYSFHLFLISSASNRSLPFLSFIVPFIWATFLPGKSHGWRSLVGYSPWDRKELDTTESLHFLSNMFSWYFQFSWRDL